MSTIQERMKLLGGCGDTDSLRSAVGELCAEFGKVRTMDVLNMAEAEKHWALCFLRLESAAQEARLMSACGVPRFGEDLLMIVHLTRAPSHAGPLSLPGS